MEKAVDKTDQGEFSWRMPYLVGRLLFLRQAEWWCGWLLCTLGVFCTYQ